MKSVALVTEYNPFHNGHLYHAQQSKSITDADVSIAIMSGNFVMRGQPAIYNKFTRTHMALSAVDLVVELPALTSLSAGPYFAETAVKVANYLGVSHLCFGSESGEINEFLNLADKLQSLENSPTFLEKSKEGKSYPRILSELIPDNDLLASPNNTLGLSYVRAIKQHAPTIQPWTISRKNSKHHDAEISHDAFASGSSIRKSLEHGNNAWQNVVPQSILKHYGQPHISLEDTFNFLKYAILSNDAKSLANIYTMNEGLEHRILQKIEQATNFSQLMTLLKTKRYTYTHIQRILMNILLNFKQQDIINDIQGVRILGMTSNGQQYLKQIKKTYPNRSYITQVNKQNAHLFKDEIHATKIYNFISKQTATDFNTPVIRV
ncbi:nucleotidyltransferase [Staphylococcus caeli]|uniref:tRNA(Met) cytidine acetate ligase n=1 Tax=Staphylococcus caeli TaxID=2201815 RepID=A0A1D4M9K3_9STAP|nr:nucleotidyltransferase [Staphylococcus caeli]SCS48066.1 Putative cytosolic protein [Staphylococcus caeli]SCS95093.1 Putative cytosolic protein [Staphylococcus caeli]